MCLSLAFVFTFTLLLALCNASSEGLYALLPGGQLALLNTSSGQPARVGPSLAAQGFTVPDCSPSAIDSTEKLFFTLARNASAAPSSPWLLVAAGLADGAVRLALALPPAFPPGLGACAHALSTDGSAHAFVAAFPGAPPRLLAGVITYAGPAHGYAALADAPTQPLGVGLPLAAPTCAATATALWVALAGGLARVNVAHGGVDGVLPTPQAQTLSSLQYDKAGLRRTYGLLAAGGSATALASFDDAGAGTPALLVEAPGAPAAARPALVALQSDRGTLVVATAGGELVTVDLATGAPASHAPLPPGGLVALAYEPFVF